MFINLQSKDNKLKLMRISLRLRYKKINQILQNLLLLQKLQLSPFKVP